MKDSGSPRREDHGSSICMHGSHNVRFTPCFFYIKPAILHMANVGAPIYKRESSLLFSEKKRVVLPAPLKPRNPGEQS